MAKALDCSTLDDAQLAAEAAREGSDGPAFRTLLERHRQRVWRLCFRLMGNEHDAHDAAQEVFVRLFMNRAKFEGRSQYGTWVHGIAVRTCLTLRRGRGRRKKHEDTLADTTLESAAPEVATPQAGLSLDLIQMLEILDEEDRAMMLLKYAEDYSYDELAAIFDVSVSACKMRLSRAKEKLQERFPNQA